MRRRLLTALIVTLTTWIAAPVASAAENRIVAIRVEEGPNNTVITIEGSGTPTFTVFKLLDPVRLLVDVAGGSIADVSGAVQVRNGVLADIETLQFATAGQRVGRIVIGFDRDAPYSVKSDGNKIRVVVDGTDRSLPTLQSDREKQALERVEAALASEKALRAQLDQAREREAQLRASQTAAQDEQKRLQTALDAARAEAERLKQVASDASRLARAADAATTGQRKAEGDAAKLAAEEVQALRREKEKLAAEKDASAKALAAAEARREALERALGLEESRRKAAIREREEEEALVRSARAARQQEEARTAAAKKERDTAGSRDTALGTARGEADRLKVRAEEAAREAEALRRELDTAKRQLALAGKGDDARVKSLQADLDRLDKEHQRELADLRAAQRKAEAAAAEREKDHEKAVAELEASERALKREVAARDAALARKSAATADAQAKAAEREKAVAVLEAREKERQSAERLAEDLRSLRLQAAQEVQALRQRQAELRDVAARLAGEKKALDAILAEKSRGEASGAALAKVVADRLAEAVRLERSLAAAEGKREGLDRDLSKQTAQVDSVRARLAREKDDLAAVLEQKTLFQKELRDLRGQSLSEKRSLDAVTRDVETAKAEARRLTAERDATARRVAELRSEVAVLERRVGPAGDLDTLKKMLSDREQEVEVLKRDLGVATSTSNQEAREQQKKLEAALAKARAEGQRTAEGREKIAQLEKFVKAQRAQIGTLEAGDKTALVARREQEIRALEGQIAELEASKKTTVELARVKDKTLRAALQQERKLSAANAKALAEVKARLESEERSLATAESRLQEETNRRRQAEAALGRTQSDLADAQKGARTLESSLDKAKARIEKLAARGEAAEKDVERLERDLRAARAQGGEVAGLQDALQKARDAQRKVEQKLADEHARRVAEGDAADKRVAELTRVKATLERSLAAERSGLSTAGADKEKVERRLSEKEAQVAELKERLEAALADTSRATALKRALEAAEAARAEARSTRKELTSTQTRVEKLMRDAENRAADTTRLEKALSDAKAQGRETATLAGELAAARRDQKRLSSELASEREARERDRTAASQRVAALERDVATGRAEVGRLGRELAAQARESETAARDRSKLERELGAKEADLASLGKQLASARAREGVAAELSAALADAQAARRDAATARSEAAAVRRELAASKAQVEELAAQKDAAVRTTARLEKDLASARAGGKDTAKLVRDLAAAEGDRQRLEAALGRAEASAARERAKLEAALSAERKERDAATAEVARLEKALSAARSEGRETGDLEKQLLAARAEGARLVAALEDEKRAREADRTKAMADVARLQKDLAAARSTGRATGELETKLAAAEREQARLEAALLAARDDERGARKKLDAAALAHTAQVTALESELASARAEGRDTAAVTKKLEAALADERRQREADRAKASSDVAKLSRELAAARSTGVDTAELAKKLGAAEKEEARLEAALTEERRQREAERVAATADVARLTKDLRAAQAAGADTAALQRKLGEATREQARLQAALDAEHTERESERAAAAAEVARLGRELATARKVGQDTGPLAARLAAAEREQARLEAALASEKEQRQHEHAAASAEVARLGSELESARAGGRETSAIAEKLAAATREQARLEAALTAERKDRETERQSAAGRVQELEAALADAKAAGADTGPLVEALDLAVKEQRRLEAALAGEKAAAERATADAEKARAERDAAGSQVAKLEKELSEVKAGGPAAVDVARVTNVAFREKDNVSRLEIDLDKKASYEIVEKTDQRIVLVVDKTRIPKVLERRLDTSDFYGPVRMVSTYADPDDENKVRVVVDLAESVANKLTRQGSSLVWEFHNGQKVANGTAMAKAERTPPRQGDPDVRYEPTAVGGERSGGAPPPEGGTGTVIPGGGTDFGVLNPFPKRGNKRRYHGTKINLTIKDADIQQVLTFLAKEGGVNIIAGENVTGAVTLHLKDVPWDLALDMILKSKGLDYVVEEGVYRVAPIEVIQKEFEQEVEKRKKLTELKNLEVRLVVVNYADAQALSTKVKDILSPKGTVNTDLRTNTLIIKDIEEHVVAAEDLVRRLDTQTPQVLIEARIVEASSNFSEEFGIQWGGNYTASPAFGNETGLIFPGIIGISGAADDSTAPTGGLIDSTPNFAVNLPAAVGSGKGGGIGLSLGSLSGAGNISLRLTAAEERGTVKIVSSPRVATLDNTQATIQQGISIPISVVSSLGVNTQFFNAELKLQVRPHVTQDGNVALVVDITKNEPNFSQTGASGNPTIERKEAHTQLLVRDGDTAVIGGIFTRNTAQSFKKIPVLSDIPFLGWIFKSKVHTDKRTELILFITPRIINRAASRVRVD